MPDPRPIPCPWCGRPNELHRCADGTDAAPRPGSVGVCWGCTRVGIFTEDGGMRKPTVFEAEEIARSERVAAVRRAVAASLYPSDAVAALRSST